MYTKVSIPKNGDGAGAATIKSPTVIIMDVDDIASEPSREVGDTELNGDYTLESDAKAVGIYATPSTIIPTEEQQGDVDARSLIKGVEYVHPGDSVDIANHTEAFLNRGVVILVKECDGTANGRVRAIGSKCNPLYMQPEYTNSGEGTNRKFVWKQAQGDKFAIATYGGTMPALASEPATGSESGA